ncbi:hypothetical protein [Novosphingobium sp. TCA1]|uniref:hypothetical protein n=1 Tax=Novosphingobium sp. TCA1 TaxID=2682474 RepID=UPI00130CEBD7|nr:hypothetical protein [Novosphingobium sp. TCA1]GFE76554.1 hypothetical protein NTCA1_42030 [Novosphingobium sp. TCA1]
MPDTSGGGFRAPIGKGAAWAMAAAALALPVTALAAAEMPASKAMEAPSSSPREDVWLHLAGAIVSDEQMVQSSERMLQALVDGFAADENMSEMEAAYPGLLTAFAEAMKPLVAEEAVRVVPLYRQDLADLYAANFNETEGAEIAAFLRSPQMVRFIAAAKANHGMNAIARDALADRDISAESIKADLRTAGIAAALQVDGADMAFITAFYRTPLGARFMALNPRKIALDQKWSNYISPEANAKLERIVIDSMVSHIAKTDPAAAEDLRKVMED